MHRSRRSFFGLMLAAALAAGPAAAQEPQVLLLATGDVAGAYFPVGVSLCRVVNVKRRTHGLRCSAVPAEGSVSNIGLLRSGEASFAIVQSDVQHAAWTGTGAFAAEGAYADLRAVMALYPEPLTLVARRDAGVSGVRDLVGKRVSVGPPGSGQRGLIDALAAELGWEAGAFAETLELEPGLAVIELCEGRIDAFFFAVGHPALAISEATASCGGALTPLAGPEVDALIAGSPLYAATEIPAGLYAGQGAATPTFGVGATLVTRADLPDDAVETIVGAILDARADLAGFEPTLGALDETAMSSRGLTAPLHPGAAAAYRARGLPD